MLLLIFDRAKMYPACQIEVLEIQLPFSRYEQTKKQYDNIKATKREVLIALNELREENKPFAEAKEYA